MSPQPAAPRSLTPLWDLPVGWTGLDSVASTAKEAVNRVIGRGRVADVLHGRWLGHPLHPEQQRVGLVHAVGNLTAVAAWAVSLGRRRPGWALAGSAVAGLAAGLGGHLSQRWAAGANHAEHVPHLAPEGWQRLGEVDELSDGRPHRVLLGDEPVVVVRSGQGLRALSATCAHLSAPLDEGEVESVWGAECIVCPWHGSAFALDGGHVVRGPATAPQPVVDLDVHDGVVFGKVRQPGE
jgi:nitrite reductase/ring-hydroxylating ferredoxin subunit